MRFISKALAIASFAAVIPAVASAQKAAMAGGEVFGKGTKLVSVGLLAGGDGYPDFGFGGAFEYGLLDITPKIKLGIGGSAGYMTESSVTAIPVYGVGNLHFSIPNQPKLDLYAGASVGITRFSIDLPSGLGGLVDNSTTDSGIGIQGGARYAATKSLLLHAQLGLVDIPLLTAGVSFKF
jgi:hypothetical protein